MHDCGGKRDHEECACFAREIVTGSLAKVTRKMTLGRWSFLGTYLRIKEAW